MIPVLARVTLRHGQIFIFAVIPYPWKFGIAKYIKFNRFSWQCAAFSSGLLGESSLNSLDLWHFNKWGMNWSLQIFFALIFTSDSKWSAFAAAETLQSTPFDCYWHVRIFTLSSSKNLHILHILTWSFSSGKTNCSQFMLVTTT